MRYHGDLLERVVLFEQIVPLHDCDIGPGLDETGCFAVVVLRDGFDGGLLLRTTCPHGCYYLNK